MEYPDIITNLKNGYNKIKYFGVNVEEDGKMTFGSMLYSFVVQVIFLGLLNAGLIIDWILNSTSIKGFASSGYIITSCIVGHVKLILLYNNKEQFRKLIRQLEKDTFKFKTEEEAITRIKEHNRFQKVQNTVFYVTIVAVLASITTPIIMKQPEKLPFPAWYPVNISLPALFYIAYFHQSVAVTVLALAYYHIDMTLCGLLMFIGLQCNVLCIRAKNLCITRSKKQQHVQLVNCVAHHCAIIRFLKTTEKVFGNIYFWQLFASTMTFCMDLFLMSLADPSSFEFAYLVMYLIAIAILLLVPCWFASEMTRKSENIPKAAFSCNWINASDSFKKELILFVQRSQRPFKLYAVGFFEISVETFVKIIRSSISYFAVLSSLNN